MGSLEGQATALQRPAGHVPDAWLGGCAQPWQPVPVGSDGARRGQHTGALAPSTAHIRSHSPPLLCLPCARRHPDALGRKKKKCCDLFPCTHRLDIFIGVCSRNRPPCRRGTAHTDPDMQLCFSNAQHRVLQGLWTPLSIPHHLE